MEVKDVLVVILSSTVLTTIITVLSNYINAKRTAVIDNITKERKEWRNQLRNIAKQVAKCEDQAQLVKTLCELKVRINAYGIARNSFFSDTIFWEIFQIIEENKSLSNEELTQKKIIIVNQISCILKFDWERSKAEIKGNNQNKAVVLGLALCFILAILKGFYYHSTSGAGRGAYVGDMKGFVDFSIWYSVLVVFSIIAIQRADKWRNQVELFIYIFYCAVGGTVSFIFLYKNSCIPNPELVDYIVIATPIITLMYSIIIKACAYAKNSRDFIISAVISSGRDVKDVIDDGNKVFFIGYRNRVKNRFPLNQTKDNEQTP